jgi:hypothetical protein
MQNPCSIDLAEGVNELVIGCNDIGERNTMLCFGLCNLGTDLEVSLPIDDDEKSFQALGAFAASIEMTESDAGLEFTFSPADKDISLKVNDGSSFTDILEIPRGSRAVSSLLLDPEAGCQHPSLGEGEKEALHRHSFGEGRPFPSLVHSRAIKARQPL